MKAREQQSRARRRYEERAAPQAFEWRAWLVPIALFALAALAFAPALGGQFIWDDEVAIQKNTLLRSLDGLRQIWTVPGGIPGEEHYWPLTHSVLWLQWNVWAGSPAGFHYFNFFLHGLIVVQIWRLARRIGVPGAAIGAALFAVHPVHAEAVAWIISIKDLLATLLSLVCIEFYLNARERGGWKWLACAAVAAAAAMLCKSSPVTLAATIAIVAWYRNGQIERRDWLWVGILGVIMIAIGLADMWVVKHSPGAKPVPAPALLDRIMQSGFTFWLYLKNLAWPFGLGPVYPKFKLDPAQPLTWLPLVLAILATASLWLARRKIGRAPLACWLFYAVSLSPVVGVIYFSFLRISPAADRYQYFASIAPLLLAGAGIERMTQNRAPRSRLYWRCATAALVIGYFLLSWRQAHFFHDTETLFRRGMQTAPNSAYIRQLMGTQCLSLRKYAEAEALYREALQIQPDYWDVACNLGVTLTSQGRERDAAAVYQRAVDGGCNECELLSNYACLLATTDDPSLRDPKKAVALAQRSVQSPYALDARFWQYLSFALESDGQIDKALEAALKARKLAEQQNHSMSVKNELDRSIAKYQRAARE